MSDATRVSAPSAFSIWMDHHWRSLLASLRALLRKPFASLLTIAVLALALALPLGLLASLQNIERFAGNVQQSREISVFLKQEASTDDARAFAENLRARDDVANVIWKTPDEGLSDLRKTSTLGEALDSLDSNPLPHLMIVTPKADDAALLTALQTNSSVDIVQHDAVWRKRLDQWLGFGAQLAWILAIVLGAAAVLVIGNTVRLDIQARREELGVLQLLGATDGFIRRPFLYLGAWYGIAAGALALVLLAGVNRALQPSLSALAGSYGSQFALQGFNVVQAAVAVAVAGFLGWIGAGFVTGHFLRQTRPMGR